MSLSLGDGFNRRKKLGADIQTWINRLSGAGSNKRRYRTLAIEGQGAYLPQPGTDRTTERHYTIEECHLKLQSLLTQDRELACRISLTNQRATAVVTDLDGVEREMTIPELLVLRNDLIPKLEQVARAVPRRAEGVNVYETGEGYVRHRKIDKLEETKETLSEKGHKVQERRTVGYEIAETTDYGLPVRDAYNEIDRVQEFGERVKQAIQEANKFELVEL
ncbi:MAG: hypothetical protein JKY65_05910 [Planctomycetes bacterium]|nr:hypothetical protein [Planctomycetota bacterium]